MSVVIKHLAFQISVHFQNLDSPKVICVACVLLMSAPLCLLMSCLLQTLVDKLVQMLLNSCLACRHSHTWPSCVHHTCVKQLQHSVCKMLLTMHEPCSIHKSGAIAHVASTLVTKLVVTGLEYACR